MRASDEARIREAEKLEQDYLLLYEDGEYAAAIPLAERACTILEKEFGRRSREFAECLNNLALLYDSQGAYGKAEPLYARALRILETKLGGDHPDIAKSLGNLATLYQTQGEYGKAEPLLERALRISENALGGDHPDVAVSLNNLAMLYGERGEYGKAAPLLERALGILENALGGDHPNVAVSLNNLAALYQNQGMYHKAEPLLERALGILENALSGDHPDIAMSLNNLATLHYQQGKYGEAKPLLERALKIREKALGGNHPAVAVSLSNLAILYSDQGEYGKAEPLLERALEINENALGRNHPGVATTLNNLATLYQDQGEYDKAEPLLKRALEIRENLLGESHPEVPVCLNNLATLYQDQGKYEKAEPLFERALGIWENALGKDHPNIASGLNNLALLYRDQGQHDKAIPLLERALVITENALGNDHIDFAVRLHNLAELYKDQREYGKAELALERALGTLEKTLGSNHPDVATGLNSLGAVYVNTNRYYSAVVTFRRVLDIHQERLGTILLSAEELRRLEHAEAMLPPLHGVVSAHLQVAPTHRPLAELALTNLLRRKGLMLEVGARYRDIAQRSMPEKHLHLFDELDSTNSRLSALEQRGPGTLPSEEYIMELVELRRTQHQLQRKISAHSPIIERLGMPIKIADIQQALPHRSVLVEYMRYFPFHQEGALLDSNAWRYAAYLVFPDRLDWVDLGPTEPIEQQVKAFRRALQLKQAVPTDLHDAVMQPVLDRLGDTRRLFIAPDADLNLTPFGALYDGERYLIERYDLHYLTTGRDLLRPWDAYGSTDDDTVMVVANPTGASLPGTEHEAELLEGLFPHVETLLRDTATEAGAQRREQPWVLHLGTHGFFEIPEPDPELEAKMNEYVLSMSPSSLPFAPGRLDNPMLHSGLVLASAGTPADMIADADDEHIAADGRLTAYEISGWDLRGTELVVLSACGSGLGEPRAGEGVLGLRRAFAMAGAQTQVMSLWDVSDATTAKLMEAYYRKLLAGKGRAEAMQEVQLEMLRSGEHHPGDWASFVVVGEWRPLSKARLPEPEGPPPVESRGCGCQRASVGGDEQPLDILVLGMLGLLVRRRRSEGAT